MSEADAVVYASIDRKILATILTHMHANNVYPRSMSDMIRGIVETFEEWARRNGAIPIETTEEATQILREHLKASLNPAHRLGKKLLNNLEQEELGEFMYGPVPKSRGRQGKWDESDDARTRALIAANLKKLGHEPK